MKTAIKKVIAIEIYCPACSAIIPSPGGPHAWDVNEVHPGATLTCPDCGAKSKTPRA